MDENEIDGAAEYLAAEGAESGRIVEAPVTDLAGVGDTLPGSRLWPLIQEHDPGAVDDVGLDSGHVNHLLNLR